MGTIKKVISGDNTRKKLLEGMKVVADAVGATAGAAGRNACIANQWGVPTLTKDGYKTSKSIELTGAEGEGVKLIQQAAEKQNQESGDSTTLVTTLTYEIAKEGLKYIEKGCNVAQLKKGIDEATQEVVRQLKLISKPITTNEEIKQVATISANGDETIGNLIAEAVEKGGKNSVITCENSKDYRTSLEMTEGLEFSNGFLSPYFMTNPEKQIGEFEKPLIFLTDYHINTLKQIQYLLEYALHSGRPIVIICDDMDDDALSNMVVNRLRGGLKCCVIKAPSFGDFRTMEMEDIAILTGAKFISEKMGVNLDTLKEDVFGSCSNMKVTQFKTTIIGGLGDKEQLDKRVSEIQAELDNVESKYDIEKLQERLAKLTGGVSVIKAGGSTEAEISEKKDRIDDAICSTKSALEEGILPGGGVALVNAVKNSVRPEPTSNNQDYINGFDIVMKAARKHLAKLAENAGETGDVILAKVEELPTNQGYNLLTKKYGDMFEMGIVDATKCIRTAVEIASSTAGALLTTECLIVPDIDEAIKMAKLANPMQMANM